MNLKEAREIVDELREMDSLRNSVSVAAIILDNRITELEGKLAELLSDAIPDKKWDKVFQGSAVDYLRHRAVHFIKSYNEPERGARLNQLANSVEELEAQNKKLVEELVETIAYHINPIKPPPPKMAFALKKIKQPALRVE